MSKHTLGFEEIDRTMAAIVGGKAANLGELSKIKGIKVPVGFCITTAGMGKISDIEKEVIRRIDPNTAYAVRSSATAEDLPTASFAGQHDTYLNVIGAEAILANVEKCWASLHNERAVAYRNQQRFDHDKVKLAVVIQEMVSPYASGVLFTADPLTGNRKIVSIDAGLGLGDALVSGLVNTDVYKVNGGKIIENKIASERNISILNGEQIRELEKIGRKIEEHFGVPQDIEWCLANDRFYIVQSRPITTLYPVPQADDTENRLYVSVGHQQMMTDAMKPLGLSFFLMTTPAPMRTAGGRLFVDFTPILQSPANRSMFIKTLGDSDPLIKDALLTIIDRGFISIPTGDTPKESIKNETHRDFGTLKDYDASIVQELIDREQKSVDDAKANIQGRSGTALFDFIVEDIAELRKVRATPDSFGVIMTGMNAARWINTKMEEWLGEKGVADTIAQSVPNNITSEMGLALLDVADVIRAYPEVIDYLQNVQHDSFLDGLAAMNGGSETREAINSFLDKYGMRCAGEIDITRSRWREKPTTLLPLILSNIRNFSPGEGKRRFKLGREESLKKEKEILDRLLKLPGGKEKSTECKRMIDLVRNFAGYREFPKYAIVSRYFIYKQSLMKEAQRLVQNKVIRKAEDVYYLTFEEFRHVVDTNKLDYNIIETRAEDYKHYEKLTPPRLITSDGEILNGRYHRENLPADAIVGLAVSAGVVEGRARVVLRMEDANVSEGDILVTRFTDPSWTPLFVSIKGLVTEVGGLMTHGAVIAREYGLPAVVGVDNVTSLIKDGQQIRLNGSDGYIELL